MRLSATMLNFLGYCLENRGYCECRLANGLGYELGIKAACKNGLIMPHAHGYVLTDKGAWLAMLGRTMRGKGFDGYKSERTKMLVRMAQGVLR